MMNCWDNWMRNSTQICAGRELCERLVFGQTALQCRAIRGSACGSASADGKGMRGDAQLGIRLPRTHNETPYESRVRIPIRSAILKCALNAPAVNTSPQSRRHASRMNKTADEQSCSSELIMAQIVPRPPKTDTGVNCRATRITQASSAVQEPSLPLS